MQGHPHVLRVPPGIILLLGHSLAQCVLQDSFHLQGPLPVPRALVGQLLVLGPLLAPRVLLGIFLPQVHPCAYCAPKGVFAARVQILPRLAFQRPLAPLWD